VFIFSCIIVTLSYSFLSFSYKEMYPLSVCTASLNRHSSIDRTFIFIFLSCVLHYLLICTTNHSPSVIGRYNLNIYELGWRQRNFVSSLLLVLIVIIVEFLTSQLWLGNIYFSWDVVINRIMFGRLICSLKSFLQLNICQELQIFAVVYMYSGAGYCYY